MAQDTNPYTARFAEVNAFIAEHETLLKSINTEEMQAFKEKYPDLDEAIRRETKAVLQEEGLLPPEQAKVRTMATKRRNYI